MLLDDVTLLSLLGYCQLLRRHSLARQNTDYTGLAHNLGQELGHVRWKHCNKRTREVFIDDLNAILQAVRRC